ncbi:DNA-processing protein DprA [Pirellulaceae bacterium SH501]
MITEYSPIELMGVLNDVEIKNAPERLFVRGDTQLLRGNGRVSIVGSRKASQGGVVRATRLAKMLSEEGFVVVSGLAEGIDVAAHKSAISHGGKTIAVIGTPIDKAYPAKHRVLQEEIAENHLLVSQFPIGSRTYPNCFPMRNRTMALLSHATVIIEAADGSGSLHQGWEALRLGRPLYLAKWQLENKSLEWPAKFLDYGAIVLDEESVVDLMLSLPRQIDVDEQSAAFSL